MSAGQTSKTYSEQFYSVAIMNQSNPALVSNNYASLFQQDKTAWENAIANYDGDDPLDLWYNYICWYEQHAALDTENAYEAILGKCLGAYEYKDNFKQDIRMVKIWMKYIDLKPNALNIYQVLYQRNVGTALTIFYIGWATYFESAGAFKETETVYTMGYANNAQPMDELQMAHAKFRMSLAQNELSSSATAPGSATISNVAMSKKRPASALNDQQRTEAEQQHYQDPHYYQRQAIQLPVQAPAEEADAYVAAEPHQTHSSSTDTTAGSHNAKRQRVQNYHHIHETHQQQLTHSHQHHNHSHAHHQQTPNEYYQRQLTASGIVQHDSNVEKVVRPEIHTYLGHQSHEHPEPTNRDTENTVDGTAITNPNPQYARQIDPTFCVADQSTYNNRYSPPDISHTHSEVSKHSATTTADAIVSSLYSVYADNMTSHDEEHKYTMASTDLDSSANDINAIRLPSDFVHIVLNDPNETWNVPLTIDDTSKLPTQYNYPKSLVYPANENIEYSPEEIRARKWFAHKNNKQQEQAEKIIETRVDNGLQYTEESLQRPSTCPNDGSVDILYANIQQPDDAKLAATMTTITTSMQNDDIESSTIRFSTGNGQSKPKTITIKFRKDTAATSSHNHETTKYAASHASDSCIISKPKKDKREKKHARRMLDGQRSVAETMRLDTDSTANTHEQVDKTPADIEALVPADRCITSPPTAALSDDSNFSYAGSSLPVTVLKSNQLHNTNNNNSNGRYSGLDDDDSNSYPISDYNFSSNDNSTGCYANAILSRHAFPGFSSASTSTPVRTMSRTAKNLTPHNFKILQRRESCLSASVQNDDSMCSLGGSTNITSPSAQNSFFAAENDSDLQKRRMDNALITIKSHLARPLVDPFNSELCKAFLTKIGFPSKEHNDLYKLVSEPINKLANARLAMLANIPFQIDKEVGRGSFGSVYRATNVNTGATVALKFQKPANNWELYICTEVHKRMTDLSVIAGFMDISAGIVAPNASIIVSEFSPFGSLLDINNRIRQSTTKVMAECLVMHFSSQILNIVNHLHACKIIHSDIKPDNFLLMKIPEINSSVPSIRLIDFGCAIDMKCFDEDTQFRTRIETDGFTCIEMQEGRPWSYQTDIFCMAGTMHVMLFGEYMQTIKKFGQWEIKNKFPRYLKKHIWSDLFGSFLNIKDINHLPDLLATKSRIDEELFGMESELRRQIRTLSNILHRR